MGFEYAVLFLCLRDLGRKERHKATTRNGISQGKQNPHGASHGGLLFICETP